MLVVGSSFQRGPTERMFGPTRDLHDKRAGLATLSPLGLALLCAIHGRGCPSDVIITMAILSCCWLAVGMRLPSGEGGG